MFLLNVVLLLHLSAEVSSESAPISYEDFISKYMWYLNALRSSVAYGMVVSNYWGKVNQPASAHMFMLEYSPEMEVYAAINVQGCQSANFIPPGGSLNFGMSQLSKGAYSANAINSLSTTNNHLSGVLPQDYNYTKLDVHRLQDIVNDWILALNHNLTDSQGQVIYNNRSLESLANVIYYKATKVGCAVQQCNYTYVAACAFNKAPQWGEPIYIADPHEYGCSTDEDCTSVINGTICTTGYWEGLCGYKTPTTTTSTTTSSTEITSSAPETSAPLRATATSAAGKTTSAAGPTKSSGTTKETEPSSTVATTTSQSDYIIKLINGMRAQVAAGNISTSYGPLPSSLHMFQLESSPELEVYAKINTIQCQNENFTPSGSSMNYYTIYETPGNNLNSTTVINLALASWMEEILNMNFGNQVTYTNQSLQEFANMMYYKSTKAGCAYQNCNQPAPPRAVVACIFNSAPETGKPTYLGTAGVTGCNNDGDCSSIFNGTKCGPQGLCGYSFTATTKLHSSTAPVTTPAVERLTSTGASGAPSKAATASTTEPGASSKAATASTKGTGTPSKAATASTHGAGTTSKAASDSTQRTGASSKAASGSTQEATTPKAASTSIPEKTTVAATTPQTVLTTTAAATTNQSELFIELINGYREKVAKGDLSTSSGSLPSSLQMFQVEYSPELEVYAKINTIQCQTENFTPSGSSMSYYTFYETPSDNLNNITVINLALASWMQEILNTNFGSQVTYTNKNMKDFANMIYYKSTKAGCSYQSCSNLTPPVAVVACVFDSAPQLGKPIYPGTQGVNGCNKDSDCSTAISGTTCGPQGLCGYSFSSTTVST